MRPGARAAAVLLMVSFAAGTARGAGNLLSPAEWLGFDPAADGKVIDSSEAAGYLEHAAASSDRVRLEEIGLSTEGRPLRCILLSTPANLARLETAPGRGGRPVVLVTAGVHPAEVGTTVAALLVVHRLAAGLARRSREVLEEFVVMVMPSMNPDGVDRVAAWLRSRGERADEALPFLQHRFAGHDLNRDWMTGSQAEARALIESVHNSRRPWLTIDIHLMPSRGPRVFIPPYAEPTDPAIPAEVLHRLEWMGSYVLDGLVRSGMTGAARRWVYDSWSPARAYPPYHGGVRFLVEVAAGRFHEPLDVREGTLEVFGGGNGATEDHPDPWQGGRWGLPEVVRYLTAATELAIEAALDDPPRLRGAPRGPGTGPVQGFNIDGREADPGAVASLLRSLATGGARIRAGMPGRFIALDPEWGSGWLRSLLECRTYPSLSLDARDGKRRPYDTASNCLAHLTGVRVAPAKGGEPLLSPDIESPPDSASLASRIPGDVREGRDGPGGRVSWLVSQRSLTSLVHIADLLESEGEVSRILEPAAGGGFDAGALLLRGPDPAIVRRLTLAGEAAARWLEPAPLEGASLAASARIEYPSVTVVQGEEPAEDEGWLRWVLEEHGFRFEARSVRDLARASAAGPGRAVFIVPDGLDMRSAPDASSRLQALARKGARVIAIGGSAREIVKGAGLPAVDAAGRRFDLQGTVVASRVAPGARKSPILWGCRSAPALFLSRGPFWISPAAPGAEAILELEPNSSPDCGRLLGADALLLQGAVPLLRIAEGSAGGEWVLFGFSPHYRGWSLATFRLLFNAVLAP
ncbi:MAG TPA: M14 family zinc carboxypeptidase [Planctomycetota bacterium]|nr:M14 family zinc carboxypeptidase [Planctomycetota bacterium]